MTSLDVATYLDSEFSNLSLVKTDNPEWLIRIADFDNLYSKQVVIFDLSGLPPDKTLDNKSTYYPSFQIRVRGSSRSYQETWNLAQTILEFLNSSSGFTVESRRYSRINSDTSFPTWLGYTEEKQQPDFSINFSMFLNKEG